jgi:hypothetical protein
MLEIFLRLIFFIGAEESGEEGARGCRLITGTATPARENICRGGGRVGAAAAWEVGRRVGCRQSGGMGRIASDGGARCSHVGFFAWHIGKMIFLAYVRIITIFV